MGAADAHIIRVARRNIPPSRHVHRLIAISNKRAIVDFVRMKRRVKVGAIALQGRGGGREGEGVSMSMRVL